MTSTSKTIFNLLILISLVGKAGAQQGANQFEKNRIFCGLSGQTGFNLIQSFTKKDEEIYQQTLAMLGSQELTGTASSPDFAKVRDEIKSTLQDLDGTKSPTIVLVFRPMIAQAAVGPIFQFSTTDFTKVNFKVLHDRKAVVDPKTKTVTDYTFGNYILGSKQFYFIVVDLPDDFYTPGGITKDNMLSNMTTKINYRRSILSQSAADLLTLAKALGGAPSTSLKITLIKMDPARVKNPCDIVASHPEFQSDQTYTVHEINIAAFQVGVTGSNLALNNVSIKNGDLVITPSADQAKSWKSNAYALFEVHLPRDVDNFRPFLQSVFSSPDKNNPRDAGQWFKDNLLDRIGIYAGAKLSTDPLSSLYGGFNFALSKTLAVNFGWAWMNDYATQVKDIGSITSVSDALKYAKREYSPGKFSIGLSFSPSYFSTLTGSKSSSSASGN